MRAGFRELLDEQIEELKQWKIIVIEDKANETVQFKMLPKDIKALSKSELSRVVRKAKNAQFFFREAGYRTVYQPPEDEETPMFILD